MSGRSSRSGRTARAAQKKQCRKKEDREVRLAGSSKNLLLRDALLIDNLKIADQC